MGIRKYKPTTPGRRAMSVSDFDTVTTDKPLKSLTKPKPKKAGRNVHGRITTRHQGGGHKQRYRVIDFRRDKDGVPAKVAEIEYDPNRSARIARLHYLDGEKRYILAPHKLKVGDVLESGEGADIKAGNALPLRNIPVGTTVHAIELRPGGGAKLGRSAGTRSSCSPRRARRRRCACPPARSAWSSRTAARPSARSATPSTTSSAAARPAAALEGRRPTVRGVVMNPVDHPHGGGEGRTSGGRHPTNPKGKPEGRTRKQEEGLDSEIIRRRGKRRR
jgi:large subunit ribosomal protein L2